MATTCPTGEPCLQHLCRSTYCVRAELGKQGFDVVDGVLVPRAEPINTVTDRRQEVVLDMQRRTAGAVDAPAPVPVAVAATPLPARRRDDDSPASLSDPTSMLSPFAPGGVFSIFNL